MIDIALCLHLMVDPQYQYYGSVTSNTQEQYDSIRWEDERQKPSWQELNVWWELNKDNILGESNA